jgi:hypothetical protein
MRGARRRRRSQEADSMLIFKRMLVFFGLFILISVILGWLVSTRQTCCYDSSASAETWIDVNGNGQRDAAEQALADVCVWSPITFEVPQENQVAELCSITSNHTDSTGQWPRRGEESHTFRAGAHCTDIDVFARPPDGYVATTPLVVNGCHARFGFAPSSTLPNAVSKSYLQEYEDYVYTKQTTYQLGYVAQVIGLFAALTVPAAILATLLVRAPKPR